MKAIDFRNTNSVWSSVIAETLSRLGVKTVVICPGSRSTPLTFAFVRHPQLETIPILDERSAAFFALGIAKRTHTPAAIVCTSGTAAANFYPAVIEAKESRIPLLVFTADRPPELRECHSGQAIDQVKIYGDYPNGYAELSTPSLDLQQLSYLRQTIVHAERRSQQPTPGVFHLNCPFGDPLPPLPEAEAEALEAVFPDGFFDGICGNIELDVRVDLDPLVAKWQQCDRGLIIAGVANPKNPKLYCNAIAQLAKHLNFPVLAEGLSPARNYASLNPYLVSTYDIILRDRNSNVNLAPDLVIQIGDLPTSKELRQWLTAVRPQHWILDPSHHNLDPLHGRTTHLNVAIETIAFSLPLQKGGMSQYRDRWLQLEAATRQKIDGDFANIETIIEPKVSWLLSQLLPPGTPIFIANSMPVRDVEWFWKPNDLRILPFFNRGANGIDGTLSTALGVANGNRPSVLLTGDLGFLHDTNGFLVAKNANVSLTIVLINNNGGGIFEMLPVSQFDPPFEDFFATPQSVDFAKLCAAYDVEYCRISSWDKLQQRLDPLPDRGLQVLEIQTDRKFDAQWRRNYWQQLS